MSSLSLFLSLIDYLSATLVKYVSTGFGQVDILDISLPKTGTNYYVVHQF